MSLRPPEIEKMRAEIRGETYRPAKRKRPQSPNPEVAKDMFTVYTGNRWMELGSRQRAAKMLFGEFWYENEICFLFANTNTGKSILAVQIGNAIARGLKTAAFPCTVADARVLYVDFELSNLQFHLRYSDAGAAFEFHDNFLRAQFNPSAENPAYNTDDDGLFEYTGPAYSQDDYLMAALEYRLEYLKISVLIIDNISCLGGGTSNAGAALKIMSKLNELRNKYNLSILVLAHTPKRRNPTQPLSVNDLHGSKLLINFANSAFTIGTSNTQKGLHYLKQIKQRSTEQLYGDDNVCLCRILKTGSFLNFTLEGHSAEAPHLLSEAKAEREKLAKQIVLLSTNNLTQKQISKKLSVSTGLVNKLLKRQRF